MAAWLIVAQVRVLQLAVAQMGRQWEAVLAVGMVRALQLAVAQMGHQLEAVLAVEMVRALQLVAEASIRGCGGACLVCVIACLDLFASGWLLWVVCLVLVAWGL